MTVVVDIHLSMKVGEKKISNATMDKTTAVGEQFGTSDFLSGC